MSSPISSFLSKASAAVRSPNPGRAGLRSSSSLGSSPDSGVPVEAPSIGLASNSDEIPVETVLEDSDLDEDVGSQGTTYSASEVFDDFQFVGEARCRVILTQKDSFKRSLICANLAGTCTRRNHRTLCQDPARVGAMGFYLLVPNSKGGSDAVLNTLRTQEDIDRQSKENVKVAEQLFSPTGDRKPSPRDRSPSSLTFGESAEMVPRKLETNQVFAPMKSALKSPPVDTSSFVSKSDLKEIMDAQAKANSRQLELFQRQMTGMLGQLVNPTQGSNATAILERPKFYALRSGVLSAVVQGQDKLREALSSFPQAEHQVFDTEQEAKQWLETSSQTTDRLAPLQQSQVDLPLQATLRKDHRTPNASSTPASGSLMHIRGNGPDRSTGTKDEIFGVKLVDRQLGTAMCPAGISADGANDCMQAMPDVSALPGKSGVTQDPASSGLDNLGQSLLEYLPLAQRPRVQRDTQWRSERRNALSSIKTTEDLTDMIQQFHDVEEMVMDNFKRALANTLDYHGYTEDQSEIYFELGAVPSIVRASLRFYYALLMKLRQYTMQCEGGWDQWKVHLAFHAKKMLLIRLHSQSRTDCVLQTYIYLRDQERNSFMSDKLQAKINEAIYDQTRKMLTEQEEVVPTSHGDQTKHNCGHCHSNLHMGGKAKCLFKELSATKARGQAKEAEKQLRANPGKCLNDVIEALA